MNNALAWLLLVVLGLMVAFCAIVADPFALPFQDWDQMPQAQQEAYLWESAVCKVLFYAGLIAFALGLIGLVHHRLSSAKRKPATVS